MGTGLPRICHRASLPFCCYNTPDRHILLRLIASPDVELVSVIYGDPFAYAKTRGPAGTEYCWQFEETSLEKQLSCGGAGPVVWRAKLALPRRRRLKYGFRLRAAGEDYYFSENGLTAYSREAAVRNYNHFFFPFIHEVDAPRVPSWVPDTVWYQIFPERFYNGDPSLSPPKTEDWERGKPGHANFFGGDLPGIRQRLGYLRDLGITGIFLNPVFKAPSNHKYDTEDYFAIDGHFGGPEDLKGLVEDAHALGIRVMLDGVFNHTGEKHPFWQDVLKHQGKSVYRDYFHIHRFPVKERYPDPEKMSFDTFALDPRMPKWNTENPQARRYLLDAAVYWIRECNIDGWRLDVSDEVSLDFWRAFAEETRAVKEDLYLVGEMWHDASNWINPGYFNAVMNYPLGFAVADFFARKTIGAEEFTRRLFRVLSRYSDLHNSLAFNLLDSHDTARILTAAGGDKLALRNAFTMLFLLPGSPCLYYGTEVGMAGGGDPECRGPMVWQEERQDRELLAFFKALIALRGEHRGLIKEGAMSYGTRQGAACWEIRREGRGLAAVYAGDRALDSGELEKELGRPVLCTGQITEGNIPPRSMAVYYR